MQVYAEAKEQNSKGVNKQGSKSAKVQNDKYANLRRITFHIPEVARLLDVTEDRAYKMARDGLLPVVRLGRQVRVDPEALQRWIC
ncbi:MAG: helix-turn-helix domain-containing protein [Alicyclobacillus sp.]|nr:helix-turn-helix domain-containing protein [Alicyclobacillus sp.]